MASQSRSLKRKGVSRFSILIILKSGNEDENSLIIKKHLLINYWHFFNFDTFLLQKRNCFFEVYLLFFVISFKIIFYQPFTANSSSLFPSRILTLYFDSCRIWYWFLQQWHDEGWCWDPTVACTIKTIISQCQGSSCWAIKEWG